MSATLYVPTILIDAVIEAVAKFVAPFVGNAVGVTDTPVPIIRAQVNRVSPPPGPFVELRDILQVNLIQPMQNQSSDPAVQQATVTTYARIDVQADLYGPSAGDWVRALEAVFRAPYAPDQFPDGIKPLYSSDAHQLPLVTGEEQYENRYVITLSLEYNPDVIIPQASATELAVKTAGSYFEDLI